jgi:hypothetical protein
VSQQTEIFEPISNAKNRKREQETCQWIHRRDSQLSHSLKTISYEWFKIHPHGIKRQKLTDLDAYLNGLGYHTTQGYLRELSHHFKVDYENAVRRLESLSLEQRMKLWKVFEVLEEFEAQVNDRWFEGSCFFM